jgi:hypothetical protein
MRAVTGDSPTECKLWFAAMKGRAANERLDSRTNGASNQCSNRVVAQSHRHITNSLRTKETKEYEEQVFCVDECGVGDVDADFGGFGPAEERQAE